MNKLTDDRNPHREFITPDNAVMLFIDHQTAIMTGIGDIDPVRFRNNVIALAKIAKLHNLPTVLSDNMPEGFAGPILPEFVELLPDAPLIHRDGPINAWDDPQDLRRGTRGRVWAKGRIAGRVQLSIHRLGNQQWHLLN